LAVGERLGFQLYPVFGVAPERWQAADAGQGDAITEAMSALAGQSGSMVAGGISGTLQDLTKRRRTEVNYFNGYVAERGPASGVPTPMHAAVAGMIRRLEAGEFGPSEVRLAQLVQNAA
jgi:2-dehydropantoate 2-reductase